MTETTPQPATSTPRQRTAVESVVNGARYVLNKHFAFVAVPGVMTALGAPPEVVLPVAGLIAVTSSGVSSRVGRSANANVSAGYAATFAGMLSATFNPSALMAAGVAVLGFGAAGGASNSARYANENPAEIHKAGRKAFFGVVGGAIFNTILPPILRNL